MPLDKPHYQDDVLPVTGRKGMVWPSVPSPQASRLVALQYQLEESEWWPAETLQHMQLLQLEQLLTHAAKTSPFYHARLRVLAGIPAGGLTLEAFRQIPILCRADLQEHGDAVHSRKPPKDHGKGGVIRTSGSTGRPIAVTRNAVTNLFFNALNLRYHTWHGRDFRAVNASIRALRGAQLKAAQDGKGLGWAPGYPSGPMFFLDSSEPVRDQLDWLRKVKPRYLVTYPSILRELLQYSNEAGLTPDTLAEVSTMAEMLDPALRDECLSIWGVPLHDIYSSQEMGLMALECPAERHYHVQSESVLIEVLDDRDQPCRPGQVGRIVATDLHNFAMPLIRYEVGDYAEVGAGCSCGRGLPVLKRVLGRYRNLLVAPDGTRFLPGFTDLVKDVMSKAPVRQAQLIQQTEDSVDFRIVVADTIDQDQERAVGDAVAAVLRPGMAVNIVVVDRFERPKNGKFEDVVCNVETAANMTTRISTKTGKSE